MIAALLGYPGSGKRTLAAWLSAKLEHLTVVNSDAFRKVLGGSSSEAAQRARLATEAGAIIPDDAFGALLAECFRDSSGPALLIGLPRNIAQARSLEVASGSRLVVIHLKASLALIDERRAAAGLQPMEVGHPGSQARLDHALAPLFTDAGSRRQLLVLDANSPVAELGTVAIRFLGEAG